MSFTASGKFESDVRVLSKFCLSLLKHSIRDARSTLIMEQIFDKVHNKVQITDRDSN